MSVIPLVVSFCLSNLTIPRITDFLNFLFYLGQMCSLMKSFKAANYKSYSGMEMIELGSEINFDVILNLISD